MFTFYQNQNMNTHSSFHSISMTTTIKHDGLLPNKKNDKKSMLPIDNESVHQSSLVSKKRKCYPRMFEVLIPLCKLRLNKGVQSLLAKKRSKSQWIGEIEKSKFDKETKYCLLDQINCGSGGRIYSITDKAKHEKYVIKYCTSDVSTSAKNYVGEKLSAYREMQILEIVKGHSNIVKLEDWWFPLKDDHKVDLIEKKSIVFTPEHDMKSDLTNNEKKPKDPLWAVGIILEKCEIDLEMLLHTSISLTSQQVKIILFQILVGVCYLHSASVIHRDIKPANILLNSEGLIKIADFGLAKLLRLPNPYYHDTGSLLLNQENSSVIPMDITTDDSQQENSYINRRTYSNSQYDSSDLDTSMTFEETTIQKTESNSPASLSCNLKTSPVLTSFNEEQPIFYPYLLSEDVCTRWYCSPEMILQPLHYDISHDIWSIGCCFAELLNVQEGSKQLEGKRGLKRPLFGGESIQYNLRILPSLPKNSIKDESLKEKHVPDLSKLHEKDQLKKIMSVLGKPTIDTIKRFENPVVRQALNSYNPPIVSLAQWTTRLFPHVNENALDLLKSMLSFHPSERPTAKQCLNHPFFSDLMSEYDILDTFDCNRNIEMAGYQEYYDMEIAWHKKLKLLHSLESQ